MDAGRKQKKTRKRRARDCREMTFESADKFKAAREKYRPSKIDVLWIAESPPAGGGYFYFERTSGANHLFRETMKALGWWPPNVPMQAGLDKTPYLRRFKESRHFLVDLSPTPVNHISSVERDAVLRKNVSYLREEVAMLRPKKLLIIKRNVHGILYPALQSVGMPEVLNREPIPFPSHGWQAEYRTRIGQLVNAAH